MSNNKDTPPNNACTRLVGVCAFSGIWCGLKLVPSNGVVSSRPPASNAHRWAVLKKGSRENMTFIKLTKDEINIDDSDFSSKPIIEGLETLVEKYDFDQGLLACGVLSSPDFGYFEL